MGLGQVHFAWCRGGLFRLQVVGFGWRAVGSCFLHKYSLSIYFPSSALKCPH
jgi:hypothetical protein